jgi:hypothetical protein
MLRVDLLDEEVYLANQLVILIGPNIGGVAVVSVCGWLQGTRDGIYLCGGEQGTRVIITSRDISSTRIYIRWLRLPCNLSKFASA